jgi:hypothetical protein
MNRERWRLIERLFNIARELRSDQRTAFLDHACGDDVELRGEIKSLLDESEEGGDFLAESVLSLGISLMSHAPGVSSDGSD